MGICCAWWRASQSKNTKWQHASVSSNSFVDSKNSPRQKQTSANGWWMRSDEGKRKTSNGRLFASGLLDASVPPSAELGASSWMWLPQRSLMGSWRLFGQPPSQAVSSSWVGLWGTIYRFRSPAPQPLPPPRSFSARQVADDP